MTSWRGSVRVPDWQRRVDRVSLSVVRVRPSVVVVRTFSRGSLGKLSRFCCGTHPTTDRNILLFTCLAKTDPHQGRHGSNTERPQI